MYDYIYSKIIDFYKKSRQMTAFSTQFVNLNLGNFVDGMLHRLKSLQYLINLKNALYLSLGYVSNDQSSLQLRLQAIRLFLFQIQNNNLSQHYYN